MQGTKNGPHSPIFFLLVAKNLYGVSTVSKHFLHGSDIHNLCLKDALGIMLSESTKEVELSIWECPNSAILCEKCRGRESLQNTGFVAALHLHPAPQWEGDEETGNDSNIEAQSQWNA